MFLFIAALNSINLKSVKQKINNGELIRFNVNEVKVKDGILSSPAISLTLDCNNQSKEDIMVEELFSIHKLYEKSETIDVVYSREDKSFIILNMCNHKYLWDEYLYEDEDTYIDIKEYDY